MKNEKQPHAPTCSFQKVKLCGAKTRNGTPCKSPAVHGKNRCRMHGGAKGSGAPKGNQNALKHGFYTQESQKIQKAISEALTILTCII